MSEFITVAHPHAGVVSDFVVEHQSVERWQDMLAFVAEVIRNERTVELLSGALAPETLAESLIAVCGEQLDENDQNLIRIMTGNGCSSVFPDTLEQFIHLHTVNEATVEVDIVSAVALSEQQLARISATMKKRLSRKAKLNCEIDKSVMTGVVVRAGDMVIDGSVRGRFERPVDVLQSQGDWNTQLNSTEISRLIKQRAAQFSVASETHSEGTTVSVSDGVIRIHGLADCMQGEMIFLPGNRYTIALNLECGSVGAVTMGPYADLAEGMKVRCTGRILEVPVGRGLLGRAVNTLGAPVDGKDPLDHDGFPAVKVIASSVIGCQPVDRPVQTGYKAVDSTIPIDRGQCELTVGDRQTDKTVLAIDAIVNQCDSGIKCIYVAIGQKASIISNVVRELEEHGTLANTIVVVATAFESVALRYLVPYAGCAMGKYFRDRDEDALIIYDDLSRQVVVYRQASLLFRRPSGREAFPGNVFYLHSRLLEHATHASAEYVEAFTRGEVKGKTGSLTALPIIETQADDVSAFVPTNMISITDGQIFLETNLSNAGIRPAINPGISISCVGGAVQTKIVKKLSDGIRITLVQYRELAAFSWFAFDLDNVARKQPDHGQKVAELLEQRQYASMSVTQQSLVLFVAERGYLAGVELLKIGSFETALLACVDCDHAPLMQETNRIDDYNDGIKGKLKGIPDSFKATQS